MDNMLKVMHAAFLAEECAEWIKSGSSKDWVEPDLKTLANMLPRQSRDQKIVLTILAGCRENTPEWESNELYRIRDELSELRATLVDI